MSYQQCWRRISEEKTNLARSTILIRGPKHLHEGFDAGAQQVVATVAE
jgi:hypothetical protein